MAEGDKLPEPLADYDRPGEPEGRWYPEPSVHPPAGWKPMPGIDTLPERPGGFHGEIRNPNLSAYEGSDFHPYSSLGEAAGAAAMGVLGARAGKRPSAKAPGAPAISKGRLFDYSRKAMEPVPKVPQVGYVEEEPAWAKGTPDWVTQQKLFSKPNMSQLQSDIDRGREMGMAGWYNMQQLKDRFVAELGEKQGPIWFQHFVDLLAGLSPQSKPWINTRNASYRYMLWRQGEEPPGKKFQPDEPYGHFLNQTHNDKVARIMSGDPGAFGPESDPKTFRFGQNLGGNYAPVTVDIHAMRALGPRGFLDASGRPIDVPKLAYHYIADVLREAASRAGEPNARGQELIWGGAGERTGQKNPPDPFLRVFEQRVEETAAQLGIPKEQVMKMVIRGQLPLKAKGGRVIDGIDHILKENYGG